MKVKVVLTLALLGILSTASARIVDISRRNGFFGHYSEVRQTYMGNLNGEQWWTLDCSNPGTVKCKLRPSAGKTQRQLDIEEVENNSLDNLMQTIENTGTASGNESHHYQTTIDNVVVDIYITISWQPDPNDSTNTLFHASISNSEE